MRVNGMIALYPLVIKGFLSKGPAVLLKIDPGLQIM